MNTLRSLISIGNTDRRLSFLRQTVLIKAISDELTVPQKLVGKVSLTFSRRHQTFWCPAAASSPIRRNVATSKRAVAVHEGQKAIGSHQLVLPGCDAWRIRMTLSRTDPQSMAAVAKSEAQPTESNSPIVIEPFYNVNRTGLAGGSKPTAHPRCLAGLTQAIDSRTARHLAVRPIA
jgi:hypothetical protein